MNDRQKYQRIISDLQDERDALKQQVSNRDELIAELRRKIDDLCARLGAAHAQTTAPKCPECKETMIEDEFADGSHYWACVSLICQPR